MASVWLVVVLLLVPAVAAAQAPIVAPSPVISPFSPIPIVINPQTPPPATIQSAPEILFPVPPPAALRPTKTFEFRPTLGDSEEYTDNFTLSPTDKISNFRSTLDGTGGRSRQQVPEWSGHLRTFRVPRHVG